jgi:hypothetical protein
MHDTSYLLLTVEVPLNYRFMLINNHNVTAADTDRFVCYTTRTLFWRPQDERTVGKLVRREDFIQYNTQAYLKFCFNLPWAQ